MKELLDLFALIPCSFFVEDEDKDKEPKKFFTTSDL